MNYLTLDGQPIMHIWKIHIDPETGEEQSYEEDIYQEIVHNIWEFVAEKTGKYIMIFDNGSDKYTYTINVIEALVK